MDNKEHQGLLREVLTQVAELRGQVEQMKEEQERLLGRYLHDEERLTRLQKSAEKLASATNKLSVLVSGLSQSS